MLFHTSRPVRSLFGGLYDRSRGGPRSTGDRRRASRFHRQDVPHLPHLLAILTSPARDWPHESPRITFLNPRAYIVIRCERRWPVELKVRNLDRKTCARVSASDSSTTKAVCVAARKMFDQGRVLGLLDVRQG